MQEFLPTSLPMLGCSSILVLKRTSLWQPSPILQCCSSSDFFHQTCLRLSDCFISGRAFPSSFHKFLPWTALKRSTAIFFSPRAEHNGAVIYSTLATSIFTWTKRENWSQISLTALPVSFTGVMWIFYPEQHFCCNWSKKVLKPGIPLLSYANLFVFFFFFFFRTSTG